MAKKPLPYPPLPPSPARIGYDWGEKDLVSYAKNKGYRYFVQFHPQYAQGKEVIRRRNQAVSWLREQCIPFTWVGGRANYEFAFQTEEDATMFKLAFG